MESLLNELLQKVSEVNSINPTINLIELKSHFSSILYKYNINYKTNDNNEDEDLSYYINMFLSIKKLEGLSSITLV